MLKFIRYAFAAMFFAASVGCLVLWWRSHDYRDACIGPVLDESIVIYLESWQGFGSMASLGEGAGYYDGQSFTYQSPHRQWQFLSKKNADTTHQMRTEDRRGQGRLFGKTFRSCYFPLWYPALIFALAGVGVLRFRRQFSIRSAIITVSVVAVLLGIIVAL